MNDTYHKIIKSKHFIAGGTKLGDYKSLPRPIASRTGFQGCISSLETNGELIDPMRHALVPSPLVEEGCEGMLAICISEMNSIVKRLMVDKKIVCPMLFY